VSCGYWATIVKTFDDGAEVGEVGEVGGDAEEAIAVGTTPDGSAIDASAADGSAKDGDAGA